MTEPIKVLLVDDHALFRRGLVRLLDEQPDFSVVGEAGDGHTAVYLCRQQQPDVVLMDVHMPGGGGIEAVRVLKQKPGVHILMLTISDKDDDLLGALAAGADGYLLKTAEPDQLCRAIRRAAVGQGVLSPEVTSRVIRAAAIQGQGQAASLSRRENEVLAQLARGATTSEIAAALVISENTVKTHIKRILEKLEASNRVEAVARATALGLLSGR
ncbi:MAG: response regulator [Anaerolineae bacterium]